VRYYTRGGNVGPYINRKYAGITGNNFDGSRIAVTNHEGYLTVYNKTGNTYEQMWLYRSIVTPSHHT